MGIAMFRSISPTKVFNSQAGWYRGDFHVHSNFSDGIFPPAALVETAKSEGMDFFVLTDHNTINGLRELVPDLDILCIPGIEVTLSIGHFTVLDIRGWHDWMEDICVFPYDDDLAWGIDRPPIKEIFVRAARQGLINCIVHPLKKSWGWHDNQTDLNYVHCIEVCNCPGEPENDLGTPRAIRLWTELLNNGYRTTALGGSDYHRPVPSPVYTGTHTSEAIGLPTTYVYAEELSSNAILSAVMRRRVYVSLGPKVSFQAEVNGKVYDIGQDVGPSTGEILFTSIVSECPEEAYAQIVRNGEVAADGTIIDGETTVVYSDTITPSQSNWYRLDVYDSSGAMLAITNPIFVGRRNHPQIQTYGEALKLAFPKGESWGFQ
jgi:hypothetical protein